MTRVPRKSECLSFSLSSFLSKLFRMDHKAFSSCRPMIAHHVEKRKALKHPRAALPPPTSRTRAAAQVYAAAQAVHARAQRAGARAAAALAFLLRVFGRQATGAGEEIEDVCQADDACETAAQVLARQL